MTRDCHASLYESLGYGDLVIADYDLYFTVARIQLIVLHHSFAKRKDPHFDFQKKHMKMSIAENR